MMVLLVVLSVVFAGLWIAAVPATGAVDGVVVDTTQQSLEPDHGLVTADGTDVSWVLVLVLPALSVLVVGVYIWRHHRVSSIDRRSPRRNRDHS